MQTPTQNVYEHGLAVWEMTKRILSGQLDGMKLPDWFIDNHRDIVNGIHHIDIVKTYNIYHDCGKPYCKTVDSEGRQHFPDHAQRSKQIWEVAFGTSSTEVQQVAELIGYDMILHTVKAVEMQAFLDQISKRTALTLLVTAFAEIHANAELFGGIESTSFKIKYKQLKKRGKQLWERFRSDPKHPYSYVIVRGDLPNSQRAVQGTHAAIEHFKINSYDFHPSLVYVVVRNESKLKQVLATLQEDSIHCSIFRDDIFNEEITAICTEPLDEGSEKRTYLKRFMLLS